MYIWSWKCILYNYCCCCWVCHCNIYYCTVSTSSVISLYISIIVATLDVSWRNFLWKNLSMNSLRACLSRIIFRYYLLLVFCMINRFNLFSKMLAEQTNSTVHSNDPVARVCPRWKTLPLKPSAALLLPIPIRKRAVSN